MDATIQAQLQTLEQERDIRILFACESGSRAWGFESPDSDYDVRFVYVHRRDWYLGLFNPQDTIDLPIDDLLDFSGWELRKALNLFLKSNASLVGWLYSPILYREDKEAMRPWRNLATDFFSPKPLVSHHLGLCKKAWHGDLQKEKVRPKRYLYALFSLFSAKWVLEKESYPPVSFHELREGLEKGDEKDAIEQLLAVKGAHPESHTIDQAPRLHTFLERELDICQRKAEALPALHHDPAPLEHYFRSQLQ